jgi:hypothetical protein
MSSSCLAVVNGLAFLESLGAVNTLTLLPRSRFRTLSSSVISVPLGSPFSRSGWAPTPLLQQY